jgi:hypothetical protein
MGDRKESGYKYFLQLVFEFQLSQSYDMVCGLEKLYRIFNVEKLIQKHSPS